MELIHLQQQNRGYNVECKFVERKQNEMTDKLEFDLRKLKNLRNEQSDMIN